jgi:hypothetical protein
MQLYGSLNYELVYIKDNILAMNTCEIMAEIPD